MYTVRRKMAVAFAAFMMTAGANAASVFDQIPADAVMVVRVNKLEQVNTKLAKLARDLGVAAMVPQAQDPLAAAQQALGILNGVDKAGDAAFVVVQNAPEGEPVYLLVPVSDYAAFLGNFQGATTDGEISTVKFGKTGGDTFVVHKGNYALLSPNKAIAAMPMTGGFKVSAVAEKEATGKDMVVIANVSALKSVLGPHLAEGREEMLNALTEKLNEEPNAAKYAPALKAGANQLLNVAEAFLRDGTNATIGLSFGDTLGVSVVSEFTEGSYLGSAVASLKNTSEPLLGGLPAGKYLMYGGSAANTETTVKVVDDVAAPVVEELKKMGTDGEPILKLFDSVHTLITESKGQRFGVFTPEVNIGQTPLIQSLAIMDGNGEKLQAAQVELTQNQSQLMAALGAQPAGMNVTVTPNAKTVGGVAFTMISTQLPDAPNDPGVAQAKQMMAIFYGPAGQQVYSGVVDGKLVNTMGLSDEQLATAITAVKGNANPLSDTAGVKAVSASLPKERLGVFYVQLDELVGTGVAAANQFGMQTNVQLPPDLPPVGVAIAKEGSALRVDAAIPATLVQSLVAAGMQVFMQMQGGGQPGGPGGL
jgi:hypothetical protein